MNHGISKGDDLKIITYLYDNRIECTVIKLNKITFRVKLKSDGRILTFYYPNEFRTCDGYGHRMIIIAKEVSCHEI